MADPLREALEKIAGLQLSDEPMSVAMARWIETTTDIARAALSAPPQEPQCPHGKTANESCTLCSPGPGNEAVTPPGVALGSGQPQTGWWCCKADFGEHEPTCPNYQAAGQECAARKALEEVVKFFPLNTMAMPIDYTLEARAAEKACCEALAHPCRPAMGREEAEKLARGTVNLYTRGMSDPALTTAIADLLQRVAGEDTELLDWLDQQTLPSKMGFVFKHAPAGTLSATLVVHLGIPPKPIREAIRAARPKGER